VFASIDLLWEHNNVHTFTVHTQSILVHQRIDYGKVNPHITVIDQIIIIIIVIRIMSIKTFRIKEKFWFWDADFWIHDERGNNAYKLCNRSWFNSNLSLKDKDGKELIVARKPLFSLNKDCYQISAFHRNPSSCSSTKTIVLAELKEKVAWFQAKHVLILDNVEYVVDASKWSSHNMFSIQSKGFTIAHVHKKRKDSTQSLWVDIAADDDDDTDDPPPLTSEESETDNPQDDNKDKIINNMFLPVVVTACLIMIQILNKQDRKFKMRLKREALDNMPLQSITSQGR
jgi:uncharacterized protein YxjI